MQLEDKTQKGKECTEDLPPVEDLIFLVAGADSVENLQVIGRLYEGLRIIAVDQDVVNVHAV